MRLSFIVVLDGQGMSAGCRQSLLASALPGDEVIVVATRDGPPVVISGVPRIAVSGPEARKGKGRPGKVVWRVVRLGAQPRPGQGVTANAGLTLASGKGVLFLTGLDRLEPAGVAKARALLADGVADVVLARFAGGSEPGWPEPGRDGALTMEALPGRMLLRRQFLRAAGLRLAEDRPALVWPAFHWNAVLKARSIRFHDGIMLHTAAERRVPEAEALGAVFALYRGMRDALPPDGPHAALRLWLARQVGHHLAALPPADYWRYAEGADPAALGGDWPEGLGGRALTALATRPLWQAVALWQGEALWHALPGIAGQEVSDDPRAQAASRAIALWRSLGARGEAGGSQST